MAALLVGVPFSHYGGYSGAFHCMTSSVVSVLVLPSSVLGIDFPISRGLLQLTKKSSPRKCLGGDGVLVAMLVMVLVEPSDSAPGSSSKMGSIESLSSY